MHVSNGFRNRIRTPNDDVRSGVPNRVKHRSTRDVVDDLRAGGRLIEVEDEVDPNLEMAEIQRRAYLAEAPAILFENVKGSPFPAVGNLFGTLDRSHFIFRSTLKQVKSVFRFLANVAYNLRLETTYLKERGARLRPRPH